MGTADLADTEREARLNDVLATYFESVEAGQPEDQEVLLARHPDLAAELATFFKEQAQVHGLGGWLRSLVQTRPPSTGAPENTITGILGDYRILREVGRGGMGVVYEAEQISLGRRVALKVLPFAATMDPRQLQRFHNEARAAAGLEHPHIVPVYGVGCERGVHYYAMKFIEGQSLAEMISGVARSESSKGVADPKSTPFEDSERATLVDSLGSDSTSAVAAFSTQRAPRDAAVFRQIGQWGIEAAEALEHAHSVGIVHRDIKPANLMIDGQGKLWITDFGLARTAADAGLTITGDVLGTLRYMSPEQALARHGLVDHRTDVYSLGVTLYELLAGRPAVDGKDRQQILNAITLDEPQPPRALDPAIPHDLETIVLKAMEKEPGDRYATAKDLANDLQHFLEDRPVVARRPTSWERAAKWTRRHRTVVRAVSAALAITVVALAASTLLAWRAYQAEAEQRQLADIRLREAKEQRRQARRAVDKMYVEVARDWLDRQPQMGDLQKQFMQEVLQYYKTFAEEEAEDEEEQFDRARAYSRVGRILMFSFDQHFQARAPLLEANALLEGLARQAPDNSAYTAELAETQILLHFSGVESGCQLLERSVALMEGLVERFPAEPDYRYSLVYSLGTLAEACVGPGRLQEGERFARRAISLAEELVRGPAARPEYQRVLANSLADHAEILRQGGNCPEAVESYQKAIAAFQKLTPDSSGQPEYQHDLQPFYWHNLGNCYRDLGSTLGLLDRVEEAKSAFATAIRIHAKLVADFPTALHFWTALFRDYRDTGTMFWARGRTREADQAYCRASEFAERMAAVFAAEDLVYDFAQFLVTCPNPKWWDARRARDWASRVTRLRQKYAEEWTVLGIAHYRLGDYPSAIAALDKARSLRPDEYAADEFFLAMAHWRLGDERQGREWYDKAVAWLNRTVVRNQDLLRYRAEAAELLGIKDSPPGADEGK
jgi:serine/threonine protein kinase